MRLNSSKRTVSERVLSGTLALALGISCTATNFFGLGDNKDVDVVKAANNTQYEADTVIRESYTGDYEIGKTYYDIGELWGEAYYGEDGWKADGNDSEYARNGWKITEITSFLDYDEDGRIDVLENGEYTNSDAIANTIPYTTGLNTEEGEDEAFRNELMCWQAAATDENNRSAYLERTDLPDFASPTYKGESTPAYYIAQGEVTENEDGEKIITWAIRSWVKDSDLWIDSATFSKPTLTALKSDATDLQTYFRGNEDAYDELTAMWSKAGFEKGAIQPQLWFGDDIDTWWEGVAAPIYKADVEYTDTQIVIDNVRDIHNNVVDGKITATLNDSVKLEDVVGARGEAENLVLKGESDKATITENTITDALSKKGITAYRLLDENANAVIPFSFDQMESLYKTSHAGNKYGNDGEREEVDGDFIIGKSKVAVTDDEDKVIDERDDLFFFVSGERLKKWVEDEEEYGIVDADSDFYNYDIDEVTFDDINDNEYYLFAEIDLSGEFDVSDEGTSYVLSEDPDDYNIMFVETIAEIFDNTAVKNGSADLWIFNDSDNDIIDQLTAGRDNRSSDEALKAKENAAIVRNVKNVEIVYDPENQQLLFSNLAGGQNHYSGELYAVDVPLTGFITNIIRTIKNVSNTTDNTVTETAYISAGYQRAGGIIKAKRIDSDISTNASTSDTKIEGKTQVGVAMKNAKITDIIHCKDLVPNNSYTLVGALYDVTTGGAIKKDGTIDKDAKDVIQYMQTNDTEYVIGIANFTADDTTADVEMAFTYDASNFAGKKIVVCEKLYKNDTDAHEERAAHTNKAEPSQIITIAAPSVATFAAGADHKTKDIKCLTNAVIYDAVSYVGLVPGQEYTLKTSFYDKDTETWHNDVYTKTFTPVSSDGYVEVEFTYDTTDLREHTLVLKEVIYIDDVEITKHEDITDEKQTVTVEKPSIGTYASVAADPTNGDDQKWADAITEVTVKDIVVYSSLVPGQKYILDAKIWDRTTGKYVTTSVDTAITQVSGHKEFTPDTANGSVIVEIGPFSTVNLQGHELVVEEILYVMDSAGVAGKEVARHVDHSDVDQMVAVKTPSIKTVATAGDGAAKTVASGSNVTIIDKISYDKLAAGETYTLVAELRASKSGVIRDNIRQTFVADASGKGEVSMTVSGIDTTKYNGEQITVIQKLYYGDALILTHEDNSGAQTVSVNVPTIDTVAADKNGESTIDCAYDAVIVDEVIFGGLTPNAKYILITNVYDVDAYQKSGELVKVCDEIKTQFSPAAANGTVSVNINVNTTKYAGHKLVVTETVYEDNDGKLGTQIVAHEDYLDADQTVTVKTPSIKTFAYLAGTESQNVGAYSKVTIEDRVQFTNFPTTGTYTIITGLYDKTAGKYINEAIAINTFDAADVVDKYLSIEFDLDTTDLKGHELVIMETVKHNNTTVVAHIDAEDKDQTIVVLTPSIGTVATDKLTKSHNLILSENAVIVDTVRYTNLIPGKEYTLVARVFDKSAGKMLDIEDTIVTFKPETADGTVDVEITLDTTDMPSETLVVFESLRVGDTEIAKHEDEDDEEQTVVVDNPGIGTLAFDSETGTHEGENSEKTVIEDTVSYRGLVPGETYVLTASLVNKATGEFISENAVSVTFTPESANGEVVVSIPVDTSKLGRVSIVVFEALTCNGKLIAVHKDIDDANQTVTYDKTDIGTHASSKATGNHTAEQSAKAIIVDRVTYTGLKIGNKYTITATPYDKATGKPLDVEPVTVEFTAETVDGYIDVEVPIDTTKLAGKSIVMFESLKYEGVEIAVHNDINDEDQTVTVMSIKTVASNEDKTSKELAKDSKVKVVDTVSYTGLTVGETYVLTGKLVDKVDSTVVVAEATLEFIPTTADGSVDMVFEFDTTGKGNKYYVAFETITQKSNNVVIGEHKDINDADQTVHVPSSTTPPPEQPPQTGDNSSFNFYIIMSLVTMLLCGTFAILGYRTKKKED